jgi:putative acetyltransferase
MYNLISIKYWNGTMKLEQILIRDETEFDIDAITEVTIAAFASLEISNQTEHLIVNALRSAGALTLSLVADVAGEVVGHIAFSPVTISDDADGWYGLGPVSVLPKCQRLGVGSALIKAGLQRLREMRAKGCCLVGHPEYYPRFGFKNIEGLSLEGVPPEVFFALSFDEDLPQGNVVFHEAFQLEES